MSNEIDIVCDRCGKTVHGLVIEAVEGLPKITGGFYDVASPSVWGEFSLTPSEQNVCDQCMWEDPRFLIKYPGNRKISIDTVPTSAPPPPEAFAEFIREAGIAKRDATKKISPQEKLLYETKNLEAKLKRMEREIPIP